MPRPNFTPRAAVPGKEEIKAARNRSDLSMPEAADLCEVAPSSWEAWEYGRNRMPAPVWRLFKILTGLEKVKIKR